MKIIITIPDSAKADIEEYQREIKIDPLERIQTEADKIVDNVQRWCIEKRKQEKRDPCDART